MMNTFVFMSEHFEFQTKVEFEFNWNLKEKGDNYDQEHV